MKGIYAATLIPLHSDLSCNHQKLAKHCLNLLERGCSGIALFGTTGEGPSFSVEERLEALDQLLDHGIPRDKIILANGSSCITDTISLGIEGMKRKVAALLISPPSFYKNITDQGVLAFYRELINKVNDPKLRLILYHVPQYSGVSISIPVIATLRKEFPEIVIGLKESEGNLAFTKTLLKEFPGFKVFVGKETHIIESVRLGGAGAICGLPNLYPELICDLLKASSNPQKLEAIFKILSGLPFIAAAKFLLGWDILRPPLSPLNSEQREKLIKEMPKL